MGIPFPDRRSLVLAIALVLGVVSLAGRVAAADLAIVDYQAVFEKYEGTSDAQRTLDREMKDWDAQAKEMRGEIEIMTTELESQRLMLSEDRLREKTEELDRLREEYQTFAEDVWGVEGRAAERNAELTAPIAERILDIIAKVGGEEKLDVILDASTGGVVWAKDDVNITTLILDELSLVVKRNEDAAAEAEAEAEEETAPDATPVEGDAPSEAADGADGGGAE